MCAAAAWQVRARVSHQARASTRSAASPASRCHRRELGAKAFGTVHAANPALLLMHGDHSCAAARSSKASCAMSRWKAVRA